MSYFGHKNYNLRLRPYPRRLRLCRRRLPIKNKSIAALIRAIDNDRKYLPYASDNQTLKTHTVNLHKNLKSNHFIYRKK